MTQRETDDNYQPFSQSQYEAPDGSYYESEDKYDTPLCIECDDAGCYRCEPPESEPDTGSDDDGGCAEWHYNDGEQHPVTPDEAYRPGVNWSTRLPHETEDQHVSRIEKDFGAEDCPKCDGSGEYGTGTQASYCYACKGKGWQDAADERRNATYYRHHPSKR